MQYSDSDENNNNKSSTVDEDLNKRIESLIDSMERLEGLALKKFSIKSAFMRGVAQGLGIIIGSTIVAGLLYAALTQFISPQLIQKMMLENMVNKEQTIK